MAHWFRVLVVMVAVFAATAGTARAQLEEIEPRTVGGRGATFVGMSGFVDRFSSPEEALPLNYTAQVDVCRFITNKFAIRVGAVGSGSLGGDHEDELLSGSGAPALHAAGGLLYYFTPRSMISMYLGAEVLGPADRARGRGYRVAPRNGGAAGGRIVAREHVHPGWHWRPAGSRRGR